jgi:ubiquinone/menaquinone biosynthesis C-methylase UbiE
MLGESEKCMFFPEKIKSIKSNDRVLEVGPGGTPHPRSDVFLEKIYTTEAAWETQRGCAPKLKTSKETVFYEGGKFPFKDNEFDYVICSHVIEHVEDVEFFLSELFRVAPKGYLEYPTIYYEYAYNFFDHLSFIKFKNKTLFYMSKQKTGFNEFLPVQKLFFYSLGMGYSKNVEDLKQIMFEGFEWDQKFDAKKALSIDDLVFDSVELPKAKTGICFFSRIARKFKRLWGVN